MVLRLTLRFHPPAARDCLRGSFRCQGVGAMERIVRGLLGGAGLIACVAFLAGQAKAQSRPVPPQLFGTVALPVSGDLYWDEWERARRDASAVPQMRRLIAPAVRMSRDSQIAYVQAAVTRAIAWRSDATEWGQHDYWASAAETLARGHGDMEDRAIVKMQALKALGISTADLYLTMGRDSVGGPETLLIVRNSGRYYVLDDSGSRPFTAESRPEFKPTLTLGYGAFWVHGYRLGSSEVRGGGKGPVTASRR